MYRYLLICLVLQTLVIDIAVYSSETDYHRGLRLIQTGQLEDAVSLFQNALRREPSNLQFQKELTSLRQIVKFRQELPNEKNAVRWSIKAEHLRRYYVQHQVVWDHLHLVLEVHRRVGSLAHAINVIDAFLMVEQYQKALDFARAQKQPDQILPLQIEQARIYYKAGEKNYACKIVRSISSEKLYSPDSLFRLARIQAQTAQYASLIKTLKRCFELTPPNILPLLKKEVEKCPEFQPIHAASEFIDVLNTRSLILSNDLSCAQKWLTTSSCSEYGHPQTSKTILSQPILQGKIDVNDWKVY
jgi:tetratricopeptide (TPR) repeat protein